jgi:hypothetical protein
MWKLNSRKKYGYYQVVKDEVKKWEKKGNCEKYYNKNLNKNKTKDQRKLNQKKHT